jgi:Carboxypeptidase regulatory-like domain
MRITRIVLCLVTLLATGSILFAQAGATGTILGSVTDPTGAVVPNAKVTVTNVATGVNFDTVSNSAGEYNAPALNPGSYRVSVEEPGFQKSVTTSFVLTVDQTVQVNVVMKPGAVTETVEVSTQAVELDTDTAAVSQLVSEKQVEELPLDGRNFVQLLFIGAGAVTMGGEQGTMRQGEGDAISINGGRPEGNNFTLDGLTTNDTAMETPSIILSQDAIQEFKVESGVYPAEYGFSVGQVNLVSKSGTNSLHGTLFESNRSYNFDAKPFPTATNIIAGSPTFNPVLELNQFGFVAGGPVYIPKVYNGHNRSFWMANYEGWRMNNGIVLQTTMPNPAVLQGNFNNETYPALPAQTVNGSPVALPGGPLPAYGTTQCQALLNLGGYNCMPVDPSTGNPFPGNAIPAAEISGASARLAQLAIASKFWPTPTIQNQPEGITNFISSEPGPLTQNQQTYRGDQDLGKLGKLFGRYTKTSYTNTAFYNSFTPAIGLEEYYEDGLQWEINHTINLGKANVNNFRLGYLSSNDPQGGPTMPSSAVSSLGVLNAFTTYSALQQTWPTVALTSYGEGGGSLNSYTGSYSPQWEVADSFTSVRGRHTIGLGFDYRYWTLTRNLDDNFYGAWTFSAATIETNNLSGSCPNATGLCGTGNGVADMLLGYYNGVNGFVPGPLSLTTTAGNPQDHVFHYVGPYVEDDWKVSPKLTINYGLRYDFRAATYEAHNHFFWLDTTNPYGGLCFADPSLAPGGKYSIVSTGTGYANYPILRYCGSVPRPAPKTPFAPRFGIDYRVTPKTVVRAGYGIFFSGYEGREIDDSADIYPYSARLSLTPTTVSSYSKFSNQVWPSYGALTPFPASTLSFIAVIEPPNPLDPYVQSWTLSVQRELAPNTTVEVNYVGNRGIHLLDRHQIAQAQDLSGANLAFCQQQNSAGAYINANTSPCPTSDRRPYQNFTGLFINSDDQGYSHYNAANVQFEHRARNLALTSIFTWAKSLDDKSSTAGAGASSGFGYQGFMDNSRPYLDYGLSDFDVPYRTVTSAVYQLPFGRGKQFASQVNRLADEAIGNWQLTGIATFQKGFPYSVGGADPLGLDGAIGQRANYTPGCNLQTNNHTGALARFSRLNMNCFTDPALGTYGDTARNWLFQPGLNNFDLSVGKGFALSERAQFVFKADFFNAFNHHQYGANVGGLLVAGSAGGSQISANVGSATGGLITGGAAAPRIVQLGGKITF